MEPVSMEPVTINRNTDLVSTNIDIEPVTVEPVTINSNTDLVSTNINMEPVTINSNMDPVTVNIYVGQYPPKSTWIQDSSTFIWI